MIWSAAWVSVRLAFWTTFWLTGLGLPLAWWIARQRGRWVFWVEAIVALPIVLPPTVLGFYLLLAMGPPSPLGSLWGSLTGSQIPFTFSGILIGSILFNLPFAVRPFIAGFRSLDERFIEASWSLGVSGPETFVRIALPLAWPAILSGMVLTFAHSMGEFGVVLMLGGNLPGVTRTLSILIYDEVQALNYSTAHQAALLLIAAAGVLLVGVLSTQPRPEGGR